MVASFFTPCRLFFIYLPDGSLWLSHKKNNAKYFNTPDTDRQGNDPKQLISNVSVVFCCCCCSISLVFFKKLFMSQGCRFDKNSFVYLK